MNKKIPVYWMHCKSCELNLENNLSSIWWIKINKISQANNFIDIDVKKEDDLNEVNKIIKKLWYTTENNKTKKNTIKDYFVIFFIFIVFWILYYFFKDLNIFNQILTSKNTSFVMVLLIWFVASLSSCLAVTWGIVLWFSKYVDDSNITQNHIKTQLKFHLWRIIWFTLLWGILGGVGSYMSWLTSLNKILLFIAWFFMLYMGLNVLNILPSITKLWIWMPKTLWSKILKMKNPKFAPIIWVLTFFLPCWFTQTMQVYAATSSSFMSWAMIMWTFALWTMPVLFLLWFWSSYFKDKNFDIVNKIIWSLVVLFWVVILGWFFNLVGVNFPQINTETTTNSTNLEEIKEVSVTHDGYWFWDIVLQWAKNYKLIITPSSNGIWCLYALTIPWIDNKEYLVRKWLPIVINIENAKPWKYRAVCTAMWMKQGSITIK